MEFIGEGIRKARKEHRCYDCYQPISVGEQHSYCTTADMGRVATIRSHMDCRAASDHYIADLPLSDFDDGVPPLADMIIEGGEIGYDLARLREAFPNVVARLEDHPEICREFYHEFVRDTKTVT